MSFSLVLTQENSVANTNNSTYRYNFLGGNFTMKNNEICISQATVPYSFFNVSPPLGNTITLTFPFATPVGPTVVTIDEGFYTVSDLNLWFQNYCITNKYYMIETSTGEYVYFLAFFTNTTYYANQIVFTTLPTAAQAVTLGWTIPVGATWTLPAVASNMTVAFASAGSICAILGFAAGSSYTGTGTTGGASSSQLSTVTPIGSSVNSLIVRSNIVNNDVGNPSDILDSFPINAAFGANINYQPSFSKWVKVADGTYSQFTILLCNELLQPVIAEDNRSLFTMLIRKAGTA